MNIDLVALRDVFFVLLVINVGPTPDNGLANLLFGLCMYVGVPLMLGAAFWKL